MKTAISELDTMIDVRFEWLPFLLSPDTPKEGMTLDEYVRKKGYPKNFFQRMKPRLHSLGRAAGIEFNHEAIERDGRHIINTIDALRLIDFAQATLPATTVNDLVEELIHSVHVHGRDVSDAKTLASIGQKFGLLHEDVLRFIEDPRAQAPLIGSPEALAAIGMGQNGEPLPTCAQDHGLSDASEGSANAPSQLTNEVSRGGSSREELAMAVATSGDLREPVGDKASILNRDRETKRAGVHSVPHIEIFRSVTVCNLCGRTPFMIRGV